MIRFDRVSAGTLRAVSFEIASGTSAKILSSSADQMSELFAVCSGVRRPDTGHVYMVDNDIYALPPDARIPFFRRIGMVPENGGLISNLKTWENLILPAWYHGTRPPADMESEVLALFREAGCNEEQVQNLMRKRPDELTKYEKRLVAVIRSILMDPDILIYDSLLTGLDREAAGRLLKLVQDFHHKKPGRVSVYLCPEDTAAARIHTDQTVTLKN
ncbi:MAG: ATP-binding cassette domain-containing protein [Pseudomonadota bacterium]